MLMTKLHIEETIVHVHDKIVQNETTVHVHDKTVH
jgi:hypothetical protein